MNAVETHHWSQIEDIPGDWKNLSEPQVEGIVKVWHDQQKELRSRGSLDVFLKKYKRKWAIETGAIEEIYRISEGATKTLIEKGLDAALISHEDVDDSPNAVVNKIRDHLDAVDGLYQFVASERSLSKSYILELHQVLTAHQETYDGRDTLGQYVKPKLPRGQWKRLPNNVEGPDGVVFNFCPPEQVDSEIERLLELFHRHLEMGVPPDIEAAWLHHRFTLIHPFTDGNGRMARCLATLVLLKGRWLPLVVTRHDKPTYISALRAADRSDLRPLVKLFGELQRKAIREALSLGRESIEETTKFQGVIASIHARFEKKKEELNDLLQRAHRTADSLQVMTQTRLEDAASEIRPILRVANSDFTASASGATIDSERAHYNHYQTGECAKQFGYFSDWEAYQSWSALTLMTESRTEILFAFHGIGRGNTGVLGCAGMMYTRRTDEGGASVIGNITPLTKEPFDFTYAEDPMNVQRRFRTWLEECVTIAVARWNDNID